MTFCILGSCVTRDIWNHADRPYDGHGKYFARTSLACIASPQISVEEGDLSLLSSNFQRQAVLADATREFLKWIVQNKPKEIIFDFIDERFDLVETGGGLLSHSFELASSKVLSAKFPQARLIPKASEEGMALWESGLSKTLEVIRAEVPASRLILHKAWFSGQLDGPEANQLGWSPSVNIPKRSGTVEEFNDLMASMYQVATAAGITDSVESDFEHRYAASEHRWGRSTMHYIESYYADCWAKLSPLIS